MKKDFLKFPLRKALFSTVILFSLSAIFSSCGDDVEGRISVNNAAPEKVTNVKTEAGPGEVYLTWTNPTRKNTSSFLRKMQTMGLPKQQSVVLPIQIRLHSPSFPAPSKVTTKVL